jgi:gliding motility-associated-like protein
MNLFIKYILIFSFLAIGYEKSNAQYNFVNNPSFEIYDSLPLYYPDSTLYVHNYFAKDWFIPVSCGFLWYRNELLNFMDTTAGSMSPYGVPQNLWDHCWPVEGHAYACMVIYRTVFEGNRMYLESKLNASLIAGKDYCLSFFVSLLDSTRITIDQIGAYISTDTLENYTWDECDSCYIIVNPQIVSPPGQFFDIRNKWYEISGVYHAMGGEKFITIGNFKGPNLTNYIWVPGGTNTFTPDGAYELDMITLFECDSVIKNAIAGNDTTICLGDSVQLGTSDSLFGYSFAWTPASGMNDSSIANPRVSPLETTTYVLQQTYYSTNTTSDEVTITVMDCDPEPSDTSSQNMLFIPNIFTPNNDGINDVFYVRGKNISLFAIKIYNRWGAMVFESTNLNLGWDGYLNGNECAAATYFYVATITFEDGSLETRNGTVTLLR